VQLELRIANWLTVDQLIKQGSVIQVEPNNSSPELRRSRGTPSNLDATEHLLVQALSS
jgi:hypothetical protein